MRVRTARNLVVALLLGPALAGAEAWQAPRTLRDTGLYADWASLTVARDALAYSPQYPLWSDGAAKQRWVRLPPGTWIDGKDPGAWRFPVGTRLWKEFRFAGRRVETRYIESTPDGWRYATYVWSADGSEAPLAPEQGIARSVALGGSAYHAIPSNYDCRACHEGRSVPVLGFTALQLSPDRDPNAPHAEAPRPGDVDLRSLAERGLVRGVPPQLLRIPPRVDGRSPNERAALGYLYANCAVCHNAEGPLASIGLSLDWTVGGGADALATAVEQPSSYRPPGGADVRVHPGAPDGSSVVVRMAARGIAAQMPPLGSSLVDEQALRVIRLWIAEDLAPRTAPASAASGSGAAASPPKPADPRQARH